MNIFKDSVGARGIIDAETSAMYERHFQVDPKFYGTRVLDGNWSGSDLKIQK